MSCHEYTYITAETYFDIIIPVNVCVIMGSLCSIEDSMYVGTRKGRGEEL